MRQSACLVFNPITVFNQITVDNYAAFFNCTPVGRASDSMMGFWSGNLFLIAPFPDRCLLVPFHKAEVNVDKGDHGLFKILKCSCYEIVR